MNFKDKKINELINIPYDCECGKRHFASIGNVAIGKGAVQKLPQFIREQQKRNGEPLSEHAKIMLIADINTWEIAGETVAKLVDQAGYPIQKFVFDIEEMHAEDKYVEDIRKAKDDDIELMIAIGSGTINDLVRYASFQENIPYFIIGTAPSMDGYASNVSPLISHNIKKTFSAVCADAIIGDTDILATAPDIMIAAGLGDIIGKYLAVNDWKISKIINEEYYCNDVAELVLYSVQKCVDSLPGLVKREPEALQYLMESLVLSGIAISYIGYSRPASGSEHHISHFLEMSAVFDGVYGQLHGSCVGMATCMVSQMYKMLLAKEWNYNEAEKHAEAFRYDVWEKETKRVFGKAADAVIALYASNKQNDTENVKKRLIVIKENEKEIRALIAQAVTDTRNTADYLTALHGLTEPKQFIKTGERLYDILTHAKDLRDRYAALQLFYDLGELNNLAHVIVEENY